MLITQLIQTDFPTLQLTDSVAFALQLLEDYEVNNLPVLVNEKFVGTLSKDILLDASETAVLASLQENLINESVKKEDYFLSALKIQAQHKQSLIGVVGESMHYEGVISAFDLLGYLSKYLGNDEPGGIIVLEIERRNYSFGEISRLVETNDAYITQLNTYTEIDTGLVIVSIKINKVEISDIIATFSRYEYVVRYYFGEEQYANELKENYDHLMMYLNL